MLTIGDPALEELDAPECLRLLGTASLGRLGFTEAALPAVQPVTFLLAEGAVLMPAVPGSRWVGAIRGDIVVLGVDSFSGDQTHGWAVTVVGPARLVGPSRAAGGGAAAATWDCFLRLEPGLVTGWRRTADVAAR
jgi:hypothetical protein